MTDTLKKIGYPLLFWLLLFAFMLSSSQLGAPPVEHRPAIDNPLSAAMATTMFCIVHYINMFLLHHFFEKKRLQAYIMGLLALIGGFSLFLYIVVFKHFVKVNIPYIVALINLIMPLLISTAYYFVRKGFTIQIKLNASQAKQLEAEMQLLKMQIQPHFLFNTLNNIYATNLTNHKDANEMIFQLADILRFVLESDKKQFIKLAEEMEIIENYVALEKLRLHDCKVTITKTGNFEGFAILSLLLLPLIENAFKYGKNRIQIQFEMQNNLFIFKCENEIISNAQRKYSGKMGLENVKKRLSLFYPNSHTFIAQDNADNVFAAELRIEL
ncbi:MAG: hypothetical protein RI894_2694 [Bacteroidota bacterium]|jgi:sensor histidine kinase YesM